MGTTSKKTGRTGGRTKSAQKRTYGAKLQPAPSRAKLARPKTMTHKKSWSIDSDNWHKFEMYVKRKKVKSESAIVSQALGRFVDEELAREERDKAAEEYFSTFEPQDLEVTAGEKTALLKKWRA